MSAVYLVVAALLAPSQTPGSQTDGWLKLGQSRHGFASPAGGRILREGLWHPIDVEVSLESPLPAGQFRLVTEGLDPWGVPARTERVLPALPAGKQRIQAFSPLAGTWAKPVRVWVEETASGNRVASARASDEEIRALNTGNTLVLISGRPLPELNRVLFTQENPNTRAKEVEETEAPPAAGLTYLKTPGDFPESHLGYGGVDLVILQPDNAWLDEWLEQKNSGRRQALALWLARGGRLMVGSTPTTWNRLGDLGKELGIGGENQLPFRAIPDQPERRLPVSGLSKWIGGNLPPLSARPLPAWETFQHADTLAAEPVPGQMTRPVVVQTGVGRGWLLVSAFELEGLVNENAPQEKEIWLAFWKKMLGELGLPRPALSAGSPLMDELADTGMGVFPFGLVVILSLVFLAMAGPLDYLFTTRILKRPEATWWTLPLLALLGVGGAVLLARSLHGEKALHRRVDLVDMVVSPDPAKRKSWAGGTSLLSLVNPHKSQLDWKLSLESQWLGETDEEWAGPGGPWLMEDRVRPGPVLSTRQGYTFGPEAQGASGIPVGPGAERLFRADWLARLQEAGISAQLTPSRTSGTLEGVIESKLPVDLEQVVLVWAGRATPVGDLPGKGGRVRVEIHRVGDAGDTAEAWRLKTHQDAGYVAGTARTGVATGKETIKKGTLPRLEPMLFARPEAEDLSRVAGLGWDQSWRLRQVNGKWRREAVLVGKVAGGPGPARLQMENTDSGIPGTGESVVIFRAFLPVESTDTTVGSAGGNGK